MSFVETALGLEVGRCVGPSAGARVLVHVGSVRSGPWAVLRLVTKGCARTGHEVIVVRLDTCLALLHAPEDKGNATEEQGTSNTSNDATDDLLVGVANASVTALIVTLLFCGRFGKGDLSGGCDRGAGASRDLRDLLVAAHCDNGGGELAQGGRKEIRGPGDGCGPDGRWRGSGGRSVSSGASCRGRAIVVVIVVVVAAIAPGGSCCGCVCGDVI